MAAEVVRDPMRADPAPTVEPAPAGTFNTDALSADLREAISDGFKAVIAATPRPAPAPPTPPFRPAPVSNPLTDAIREAVGPDLAAVGLAAQSALDMASFYSNPKNHDDGAIEHRDEIEQAFTRLAASGHPFTRQDVWEWYKGHNFDKFSAERSKKHDEQVTRTGINTAVVGPGSPPRGGEAKDPWSMSHDELSKALDGVTF